MPDLTDAQRLMVADGFPPELFRTAEERRGWWKDNAAPSRPPKELKQKGNLMIPIAKKTKTPSKSPQKSADATSGEAPRKTRGASKARSTARRKTSGSPPRAIRPGSKLEIVVRLLTRSKGCTTADALAATGWPSISMPQQARAAGLALRQEKDGKVTRYWGVPSP